MEEIYIKNTDFFIHHISFALLHFAFEEEFSSGEKKAELSIEGMPVKLKKQSIGKTKHKKSTPS